MKHAPKFHLSFRADYPDLKSGTASDAIVAALVAARTLEEQNDAMRSLVNNWLLHSDGGHLRPLYERLSGNNIKVYRSNSSF